MGDLLTHKRMGLLLFIQPLPLSRKALHFGKEEADL